MGEMLLDYTGKQKVPAGYLVIDDEVTFLRCALDEHYLLVRGAWLCTWAKTFCHGRGLHYRELFPPEQYLQQLLPTLTKPQLETLYQQLPPATIEALGTLNTIRELLSHLYPHSSLWQDTPTATHAATWLIWLYEQKPPAAYTPLIETQCQRWQRYIDDQPTHQLYNARTSPQAQKQLLAWAGAIQDTTLAHQLGVFPHRLPDKLQSALKKGWRNEILNHEGAYLLTIADSPLRDDIWQQIARETINYLEYHPDHLTPNLRDVLLSYLDPHDQTKLHRLIPPDSPPLPPTNPTDLFQWFRQTYLPARQWQAGQPNAHAGAIQQQLAEAQEAFSQWYLEQYPHALSGGPLQDYLVFQRMSALASENTSNTITLVIVMDGLHLLDAQRLISYVKQEDMERLTIIEDGCALAPLPTITEICKPALMAGVAPNLAEPQKYIGPVLSERDNPAPILNKAQVGDVYLWRIMVPDSTYHDKNGSDSLLEDVTGSLQTMARKLVNLVREVATERLLRLVITTDHGRLLARTERNLAIPVGLHSHGRAALGKAPVQFDNKGYLVEGEKLAYLDAGRFGLHEDAAVAWGLNNFQTNDGRGGVDWYPHGGASPEEVIVPWIVLVRDMVLPELTGSLHGRGTAQQDGSLTVKLRNLGSIPVHATKLTLTINKQSITFPLNLELPPVTPDNQLIPWHPWPSQRDLQTITTALVTVRLPNKLSHQITLKLQENDLTSIEMYQRDDDDILGDLL
jgi:hypothetical protein